MSNANYIDLDQFKSLFSKPKVAEPEEIKANKVSTRRRIEELTTDINQQFKEVWDEA